MPSLGYGAVERKPPADPMVRHQHEFPLERSYTVAAAAVARWA